MERTGLERRGSGRKVALCALGAGLLQAGCGRTASGERTRPAALVESALDDIVPNARASEAARPSESKPCAAEPAPAESPERGARPPRVYAKTRFVWIRESPDWGSQWIGYLWYGDSVPLKTGKPVHTPGCTAWYEISPRGYVCVDGKRATLDENDAEYVKVARRAPDYSSHSPHRYAESLGAPRYATLPTHEEERAREPDLRQYLEVLDAVSRGTFSAPDLAGVDLSPAAEVAPELTGLPLDLQVQRWAWHKRSTIAYLGEFRHGPRTFLLTSDFAWIPKDRTRPYAPIEFHGVRLDGSVRLPIAFVRERPRPAYRRRAPGDFVPEENFLLPRLGWLPLTGREETAGADAYLETGLHGLWVHRKDVVVPHPSDRTPWGSVVGVPDPNPPKGRATWIESDIYGGWLIAYEGTYPAYVTLSSPGRGGAPMAGKTLIETGSTPTGRFVVTGKFRGATMDAPDGISHADVPWVQNFSGPYAIHSAYWHDAWGERVSGGCINVSPKDGLWLFDFTEPRVPEGWYAVRWDPSRDASTSVIVHR